MSIPRPKPALTLLICEDEAIIALALEQALEAMGHQICAIVATAEEAVAAACRYRPDAVMMDIMLRGPRDGIEAAREILVRFGIRSLFMTAVDAPAIRERAEQVKALGFLMKPYRADELRQTLLRLQPQLVVPGPAIALAPGHADPAAL